MNTGINEYFCYKKLNILKLLYFIILYGFNFKQLSYLFLRYSVLNLKIISLKMIKNILFLYYFPLFNFFLNKHIIFK